MFKHKGKYMIYLFVRDNDDSSCLYELYECIANYSFECEEEWGNEDFNFPI